MDAIIKRIGQDLTFVWTINKKDGSQLFLEDKEVSLYMSSPRGRIIFKNLVIKNNQIEWIFYGKDQVSTGDYTATVKISNGNSGVIIIDKSNCLRLVSKTFMEGNENEGIKNGDTILFSSEVNAFQIMPIIPTADEEGNIFADGKLVTDIIPNTLARVNEFLTFASISESERKEAESARKIAESSRVSAESGRVKTEGARQTAESARQTAEAKRQTDTAAAIKNAETATTEANNAAESANTAAGKAEEAARETLLTNEKVNQQESKRVIAEGERGGNEIKRQTAEAGRVKSEESRVLTESSRQKSEQARQQAEESRATAEENRVSAETLRSTAESERKKAEDTRIVSEQVRTAAESARVKAEESRVAAESVRETAEHQRQTDTATAIKNAEKATAAANDTAGKANAAANRADKGANNLGIEDYPEFSAEKSYIVGDVVRYAGRLYRFISAHPAGAWTDTDAEQTSVKEELDRAVAMKANVDGYYETMRVGTADNLTARGDASEEIIMNRTAGGNNVIESGDALIKSIKGNSLTITQVVNIEALPSDEYFTIEQYKDNGVKCNPSGQPSEPGSLNWSSGWLKLSSNLLKDHIYYYSLKYTRIAKRTDVGEFTPKEVYLSAFYDKYEVEIGIPKVLCNIKTINSNKCNLTLNDCTVTVENIQLVNLTQMFGTGNEPATPEEFAHRLGYDSIEQVPYLPYNEGEIVSCNAEGLRTTDAEGDTYERKWATTLHEYFPRGLQAVGNVYDEITPTKAIKRIGSVDLGTLVWTLRTSFNGYCYYADVIDKNKKRLECNVIAAGYVSIPENGTDSNIFSKMLDGCIAGFYNLTSSNSWVYIRDDRYTSVEEFIAGVTGKLLYYELATPEEYTYDELNLSMRVSSGGTEEAIIPEGVLSTPLKIDVVYPIDTYGTIVNNKKNIGNISQLQTSAKTDLVSAINENNQLAKDAVLKKEQELTPEEQTQVQSNIGVKDTIDLVGAGEAQQVPVDMAHDGKFINFGNKLIESESIYFISNPIRVRKGDIITGTIWATSRVSVITQVDSTGNIIETLLRGSTEENTNVNYVCDRDMHICFSARKDRFTIQIRPCKLAGGIVSSRTSLRPLYEASGARYNEEKGVWALNGIELTDEEMAEVYSFGNLANSNGVDWRNRLSGYKGKTTIPYQYQLGNYLYARLNMQGAFSNCPNLVTLKISNGDVYPIFADAFFYYTPKLREVLSIIDMHDCTSTDSFAPNAKALENVKIKNLQSSLSFSDSPLLTVEDTEESTLGYLVANAINKDPITVTLHADAYARVPESLKTKAQGKQISIVSA